MKPELEFVEGLSEVPLVAFEGGGDEFGDLVAEVRVREFGFDDFEQERDGFVLRRLGESQLEAVFQEGFEMVLGLRSEDTDDRVA